MNPATISALLHSSPASRSRTITAGAIFGIISFVLTAYMPPRSTVWPIPPVGIIWQTGVVALFSLANGFFRIYGLLRNPRAQDFSFIAGIRYCQRREIAAEALRRSRDEMLWLTASAALPYCILDYAWNHSSPVALLAGPVIVLSGIAATGYCLQKMVQSAIIKPDSKDKKERASGVDARAGRGFAKAHTYPMSRFGAGSLSVALFKRLVLYIRRREALIFVFSAIASPLLAALLITVIKSKHGSFNDFLALLFPLLLFSGLREVISEANGALARCPYYRIKRKDAFLSSLALTVVLVLPSMAIAMAYALAADVAIHTIARIGNIIAAGAGVSWVLAQSALESGISEKQGDAHLPFLLPMLLGALIPHTGFAMSGAFLTWRIIAEVRRFDECWEVRSQRPENKT